MLKCVYWALIQNENEYMIDINKVEKKYINELERWLAETLT